MIGLVPLGVRTVHDIIKNHRRKKSNEMWLTGGPERDCQPCCASRPHGAVRTFGVTAWKTGRGTINMSTTGMHDHSRQHAHVVDVVDTETPFPHVRGVGRA